MKKNLLICFIFFIIIFPSKTKAFISTSLSTGSTGEEVTELQNSLKKLGLYSGSIDGNFQNATKDAVIKFQKVNNIKPTNGYFGPISRKKLYQLTQNKSETKTTPIIQNAKNKSDKFELKSEFLKDELVAQQIASGKIKNYDIKNYNFIYGSTNKNVNEKDFAYRFINGIKMTGQTIGNNTMSGHYPSEDILNKFQLYWGFLKSSKIDGVILKKLDDLLASTEVNEKNGAKNFPLYEHFIETPKNQETKIHVAYIYNQTFKELPSKIVVWNEKNFQKYFLYQLKGRYDNFDNPNYKICDTFLYDEIGDGCVFINGFFHVIDDFDTAVTIIHEYAHYIDGNLYQKELGTSQGMVDTTNFYNISFDTSKSIPSTFGKAYAYKNPKNIKDELVSGYARGWGGIESDGIEYSTPYEDFAESFTMYIVQGKVFRKLSETNPVLKQKYDWLKQNIFNGQEYQSGDITGIEKIKNKPTGVLTQINTGAFNSRDYSQSIDNFVWNYQFLNGSIYTK